MFRFQRLRPLLVVALLMLPVPVIAIDAAFVDKCFHTPFGLYLTPLEAWQMKQQNPDGVLFVDVRTRSEVQYALEIMPMPISL